MVPIFVKDSPEESYSRIVFKDSKSSIPPASASNVNCYQKYFVTIPKIRTLLSMLTAARPVLGLGKYAPALQLRRSGSKISVESV